MGKLLILDGSPQAMLHQQEEVMEQEHRVGDVLWPFVILLLLMTWKNQRPICVAKPLKKKDYCQGDFQYSEAM